MDPGRPIKTTEVARLIKRASPLANTNFLQWGLLIMFLLVWLLLYCFISSSPSSFSFSPSYSSCWFLFNTQMLPWLSFGFLTSLALFVSLYVKENTPIANCEYVLLLPSITYYTHVSFYNVFFVIKKPPHILLVRLAKCIKKKYFITAHSSKKLLSWHFAYVVILRMFSGYIWVGFAFVLYVLGDFLPSSLFVFVTFHLFFCKSTWLYSVSTDV